MAGLVDAGGAGVGAQHAAPLLAARRLPLKAASAVGAEPRLEPRYADVALPVPVPRSYTYLIPAELAERVVPGSRVVVPVQRRQVVGLVVAVDVPAPEVPARPIAVAPDGEPVLSAALIELGRWIGSYYGAPLGLALRALLPGALWSVQRPAGPPEQAERVLVLTEALPSLLERERAFRSAPKRRVCYEALEALGGSAPVRHLVDRLGLTRAGLDGLVQQRLAPYTDVPRARAPFAGRSSPPPPSLTEGQRAVVAGIAATPPDIPVLIHGVTGSGKTLVYLDLLRSVVASGQGAILLVPEIALTPQTVARVRGVFGDQVAVLHSGLSDAERASRGRGPRDPLDRAARSCGAGGALPLRAGDPAAEPPRLRHVPPVPRVRRRARLPALRHHPHGPPDAAGIALSLLWARGADSGGVPGVRQGDPADARARHPAARALREPAVPRGPDRPHGSRHHEHQVGTPSHPRAHGPGKARHPARHPDDREGAGFPQRDRGGRGGRRHWAPPSRLPSRRAHVSARGTSGGAGGPGAQRRAGVRPDAGARPPRNSGSRCSLGCRLRGRRAAVARAAQPCLPAARRAGAVRRRPRGRAAGPGRGGGRRGVAQAREHGAAGWRADGAGTGAVSDHAAQGALALARAHQVAGSAPDRSGGARVGAGERRGRARGGRRGPRSRFITVTYLPPRRQTRTLTVHSAFRIPHSALAL